MSTAEQQRRWRASKGARTGAPGRPPIYECTYRRHLAAGEKPCSVCAERERERQRALRAKRKG